MQNKSKFNLLQTLCLGSVFFLLMACRKELPPKYSGKSFLYFMNGPSRTYSSLVSLYNQDGIRTNVDYDFPLIIQMDGKLSDKDRPFILELEGNGKDYMVLPHPDSLRIKANSTQYQLNLLLVRPPLSDTTMKTVTLILKNNDPFNPEYHTWHKVTYKFGNWFDVPRYYHLHEPFYGKFSAAKMYTIQEAVSRKGSTYWEANSNVITINNYVEQNGGKPVIFNPFTFNDLYNFMDIQELLLGMTAGPLRDAYNNLNSEMIALSKLLLVEKRSAGNPVLDSSGIEISFP